MKNKKMFILVLAVMLFGSSLTLTVHTDAGSYTFGGSCKRFFTTTKCLEQSDKNWLPVIHPYYNENKETATSSMHIAGSVEKADIC